MAQIDKNQMLEVDNPIRTTFFERNKADIEAVLLVDQRIVDLHKFQKEKRMHMWVKPPYLIR